MTETWDINLTERNGRLTSIFFDTRFSGIAPLRDHGVLAQISLKMRAPDERGMSTNEEYADLIAFEDRFIPAMTADGAAIFVGRFTTGGRRIFFFYGTNETALRALAGMSASGCSYPIELEIEPDPGWSFYRDHILPTPDENQMIQNRHVLDSLRQAGDQLTVPRKIDHRGYFPSQEAQEVFAGLIELDGFTTRYFSADVPGKGRYGLDFSRVDVPQGIDDIVWVIFQRISDLGGDYDGWGCPVVKGIAPAQSWSMSGRIQ